MRAVLSSPRDRWAELAPFAMAALSVFGVAAANGGYFEREWGWTALALLLAGIAVPMAGQPVTLGRLELSFIGCLLAFALWSLASGFWSSGWTLPVLSAARLLVYVSAAWAALVVTRKEHVPSLLAGVVAGVVAISGWALAGKLFDPTGGATQLSGPLSYWNALGLMAACGIVLALGFAAHGRSARTRSAAALALVLLVPTLYLTFSRGSSLALVAGLAGVVALEKQRLRFVTYVIVLAAPPLLAVLAVSRLTALSSADASEAAATSAGHVLAALLAALMPVAIAAPGALERLALDQRLSRRGLRRIGLILIVVGVVGAVGLVAEQGGPAAVLRRASDSFSAGAPAGGRKLDQRLLSVSGHGRSAYWRVALREIEAHPVLGGGAGSWERWWNRLRPNPFPARNAHNLYLETLAELGPVGLLSLLAALFIPFLALRRVRGEALAPAACGTYVAFLVHAALDWSWQIPAATLPALIAACALLAWTKPSGRPSVGWPLLAAAAGLAALAAFVQVGASALTGVGTEGPRAAAQARHAERLQPWSFEPVQRLGEAQLAAGDLTAAQTAFRRALRLDSAEWSLWLDLALASTGREHHLALDQARALNPLAPELAGLH